MTSAATVPPTPFLVRHGVPPGLRGLVAGIVGYSESCDRPVVRRQVAGTLIPLVLSSGPTLDVVGAAGEDGARRYGSFVAGFMPNPVTTSFETRQCCLQIYLTPIGAFRLLRRPGRELTARVVDVDDVTRAFGQPVLEELWSARTWARRFDLIDRRLLTLSSSAPEPAPYVKWMWRRIQRTGGRARIDDLVRQTGWSHRHVIARFTEQIGVGPKLASRVVRFERAMSALRYHSAADVAAQLGFADQSHLVREVRSFSGWAPGALKAAQPTTAYSAIGNHPGSVGSGSVDRRERRSGAVARWDRPRGRGHWSGGVR